MKTLLTILLVAFLNLGGGEWNTDFNKAKMEAKNSNKLILLYFSGSDWCTYCIQAKKGLLEKDVFKSHAEKELILVNADFPRGKKHKLDKATAQQNDALAAKYNPNGALPLMILMDSNGNEIKRWEGLPEGNADEFVEQLKVAEARHE